MDNNYQLICLYCGHSWRLNYLPNNPPYCLICKDLKIKVIDIAKQKIDYYKTRFLVEEEEPYCQDMD